MNDLYFNHYVEHLNIHIYRMLHKGLNKLPDFEEYYFPEVLTSEVYRAILAHSELFVLLQYVFHVSVNIPQGCVTYGLPKRDKYDKAMMAIGKHCEDSEQISRVIRYIKEEKKHGIKKSS